MVNKCLSVSIKWHSSSPFPLFFFQVVSKSYSLVYQAVHDRVNLSGGIYKYIAHITASISLNTDGKTDVNPLPFRQGMCCIWSNEHILNVPELITSQWYSTRPNQGPAQAARAEMSPCCTQVHQSFSLSLPTALPELILANAGIWAMTSEGVHQQLIFAQSFFFF